MDASSSAATMKTVDDVISDIGFGPFQMAVIVLCGLVQACDMLEIQYVSMMSQKLQCIWWISDYWKSLITASTFVGLFIGAYLWGPLGDKHCRRSITTVCMAFVLFYGCMTALAPNIVWVVILRLLVGTGIGGVQPVSSAMLAEFMPAETRGLAWFLFQSLWCIGGVLEIGMAWLLLDLPHGWRYLAVLTALPMLLLALPWTLWLPRSPRQSLLQGRLAETRKTLDRMADLNRQPRYVGEFLVDDLQGKFKKGSIPQLLVPETYLRQTLQLAVILFASGFCYYGLIMLNVQVPVLLRDRCPLGVGNATQGASGLDRTCHSCTAFNYVELLVPTFADMLGSLLNGLLIERLLGRRVLMAVYFCVSAVLMPLLSFCMDTGARIALFFIIRFFVSSGYSFAGLYVLESYPTTLRTTAAGFHSSFARVATIVAPFVAQVFIVRVSLLGGLFIFTGLLAAATLFVALLPLETKDQPLSQTVVATLVGDPAVQGDGGVASGDDERTAVLRAAATDDDKVAGTGGGAGSYGSVSPKTD